MVLGRDDTSSVKSGQRDDDKRSSGWSSATVGVVVPLRIEANANGAITDEIHRLSPSLEET